MIKRTKGFLLLFFVLLMLIPISKNPYFNLIILRILISCIMAVGVDVCTGVSGQVSLGQAGFMAIGGYIAGKTMSIFSGYQYILLSVILSVVITGLLAYLIGYFILRLKGDYLSIATMALGEIMVLFFEMSSFFGKARGLYGIEKFNNLYLSYGFFVLSICVGLFFVKSPTGFLCFAAGQDPVAAKSIGIKTVHLKLFAFVLSAIICSIGGILYSGTLGFISPSDFDFGKSVDCLAAVVLGGPKTIVGPVIAAIVIELTTIFLQPIAEYRMIVYGVLLIYFAHKRYGGKAVSYGK